VAGEPRAAEPRATETTDEVVTTETPPTDKNDEVVEAKTRPTSDEILETDMRPTDTSAEAEQTEGRPDLVWDAEARGLCVRVYVRLRFRGKVRKQLFRIRTNLFSERKSVLKLNCCAAEPGRGKASWLLQLVKLNTN
jgi:hypothetical protein